jgi:hypothetical protein
LKPQPIPSRFNPPSFEDTKPGDLFLCPDILGANSGAVLVKCKDYGIYHVMGQREFVENHSPIKPGEKRWVKETYRPYISNIEQDCVQYKADGAVLPAETVGNSHERINAAFQWNAYCEQYWNCETGENFAPWYSSALMSHWASRYTVEIISVRVEQRDGKWCWIIKAKEARAGK